MAKQSQVEKALGNLRAEMAIIQMAIVKLEEQQRETTRIVKKPTPARKVRKLGSVLDEPAP